MNKKTGNDIDWLNQKLQNIIGGIIVRTIMDRFPPIMPASLSPVCVTSTLSFTGTTRPPFFSMQNPVLTPGYCSMTRRSSSIKLPPLQLLFYPCTPLHRNCPPPTVFNKNNCYCFDCAKNLHLQPCMLKLIKNTG